MGRPKGQIDYQRRLRAFEMYAGGLKKSEIARELGVTRPTVQNWAKADQWDERLYKVTVDAEKAVDHVLGNTVADVLADLRLKMRKRVAELEMLCGPANKPEVRLRAIQAWLRLAGIDKAMPNPAAPTTPQSIRLISDELEDDV